MRLGLAGAAALALATAATGGCAPGTTSAARAATVPLTIASASAAHKFEVEVARTPEQQSRGLMFRKTIAPDGGMIFPFSPPREASFWMKNTVAPLDMIFIRADGSIARIAADTIPYSLAPVNSGEPVAAVLEIAGGRAAQLGIAEGDKVSWPG